MGRINIQEDWGSIFPSALNFCIRKIFDYHILYIMFEMLANSHTHLVERLPNFVLVNDPCSQSTMLKNNFCYH